MSKTDVRTLLGHIIPDVGVEQEALEIAKELDQTNRLLQGIEAGQGIANLSSGQGGQPRPQNILNSLVPLVQPGTVMEMLLTAEARQQVTPIVVKGLTDQFVPAGAEKTFIAPIPSNNVGMIVFVHTMYALPESRYVTLIEHKEDNNPPSIQNAALDRDVTVKGVFLYPVHDKITHVVKNNWWHDVYFADEVQAILATDDFYRKTWVPYWQARVQEIISTTRQGV